MAKVLLGMSGGVDSTVSASLLRKMGYDVTGITFIMHDGGIDSIPSAERAAAQAGVNFVTEDIRNAFKRNVCDVFASEYVAGRTPNPCIICNRTIKFPYLLDYADRNGFDYIATGHYASVTQKNGFYYISVAADTAKDQSYFLYSLNQKILSRLILPLSALTKEEVRAYASEMGFSSAIQKDSQDICFISDGDAGNYVKKALNISNSSGDFTDETGRVLGRHTGVFNYTVGQRRGLGISAASRIFVKNIIPEENRVVLCTEDKLYRNKVIIRDCIFADGSVPESAFSADVRLRYTKKVARATVTPIGENIFAAIFDEPQRAPAPGQAAVFYDGDVVIGGGCISGEV